MKYVIAEKYINNYDDTLEKLRSAAGNSFKNLVAASRQPNMTKRQLKKVIYQAAKDALYTCSDAAGQLSCAFYENNATGPVETEIPRLPGYIRKRIHEHIETYALTHELGDDEFMRLLAEDVGCEVVQHANRTTKHNAVKNGVRYARVPFGNSCAFCLMLASRGFVYETKTTAGEDKGHYHAHCRCKIVAGKKGTEIKGYDPDGLNKRMQQVAQELGISDFSWYRYQGNSAVQAVLQREIRLRDKDWLLTGKPPEVDYSNNPRENYGIRKVENNDYSKENFKKRGNEWRDLFVHDTLAKNGYKVQPQGGADIDLRINGQPWEVKSPIPTRDPNSGSLRWVENNVKAANTQFKKRGINGETSLILSGYYYATDDAVIEKELVKRARQHKVKRVMFIDKTGNIKRLI